MLKLSLVINPQPAYNVSFYVSPLNSFVVLNTYILKFIDDNYL